MKFKFTKITAAVAFVLVTTTGAIGSDSKRVGAYDFGYLTSAHQKAAPVQVFDNGRATYFQFRAGEAIPAIFAKVAGVTTLLVPEHEGPYIKVPSVHGEFTLQLGRSQAMVVHGDGVRLDAPAISTVSPSGMKAPYMGGQVAPGTRLVASLASQAPAIVDDAEDRNSYATPVKGDRVQWGTGEASTQSHAVWFGKGRSILGPQGKALLVKLAKTSPPGTTFTVVGRDDDSLKEGIEQARAEAMPIPQQCLEAGSVLRGGDDEDVLDARRQQSGERVVDHRLVVDGLQLFAGDEGQRIQAAAGAAGQYNPLFDSGHALSPIDRER
jgi:hypothetical protein